MVRKGDVLRVLAAWWYLLAFALIGYGFFVMYTYGDGKASSPGGQAGHVVGGDAYNFIIIGVRGLGFITSGLAVTVIGAASSICAALATNSSTSVDQPEMQSHSA